MQEREHRADSEALRAGYERLRAAVLAGEAGGRLGHGVLSARGTVGWISAFGDLAPPAPAGPRGAGPAPPSSSGNDSAPAGQSVSLRGADQVVAVLAQMTLAIAA